MTDVSRDRNAFAFGAKPSGCVYNVAVSSRLLFFDCSASQMEALSIFERSVAIYQSTWHNIVEDLTL
jgi:hypothetical protein